MTAYHEHVCLVLAQRSRGVLTHLHSLDRKVISKRRNFSSKVLKVHTAPLPHYPNRNVFSDRWNLLHDRTIALPICCTIIYCTHSFALSESGFTDVVYCYDVFSDADLCWWFERQLTDDTCERSDWGWRGRDRREPSVWIIRGTRLCHWPRHWLRRTGSGLEVVRLCFERVQVQVQDTLSQKHVTTFSTITLTISVRLQWFLA